MLEFSIQVIYDDGITFFNLTTLPQNNKRYISGTSQQQLDRDVTEM